MNPLTQVRVVGLEPTTYGLKVAGINSKPPLHDSRKYWHTNTLQLLYTNLRFVHYSSLRFKQTSKTPCYLRSFQANLENLYGILYHSS